MGLGQSKQYRPRYPPHIQPYQQPSQPFIPGYVPVNYMQPVYPQPGFIPPMYGQGAVLPPRMLHHFPEERQRKRKSRRRTTTDAYASAFIPPRDQPSPPEVEPRRVRSQSHRPRETVAAPFASSPMERNQSRRAPTPFIPRMAEAEEEEEEDDDDHVDRSRSGPTQRERPASRPVRHSPIHYEQPPVAVRGDISGLAPIVPANRSAFGPSGHKPPTPLRNPLPPPPKDIYEMTPYKALLDLPRTTALLTAFEPKQNTVTVNPLPSNGGVARKKSIFRVFSRKDKKPEQKNPVIVFVPASSQPQQPLNQPQPSSITRSSAQTRQSEAHPQTRPRSMSRQRPPFAGAGPRDTPTPTTVEHTTGGTYQTQDDSSSVSSEALSPPIPPHPTIPPTIKFDQSRSYTQFMNHSPHRVVWDGLEYPTALHVYEALKFLDHRPDIAEQIRQCANVYEVYPLTAKYANLQRLDWSEQFLPLMEAVIHRKFRQHPDLRVMLLGTGNADLEYADSDAYWGSGVDGQGANELGKVFTRVREQLREDSTP